MIGVSDTTGYHWFNKQTLPSGVNLLKLQYLLELIGYTIIERETLTKSLHELAIQLAIQALSPKDAAEYTNVSENSVMRWCAGKSNPVATMEVTLLELLELHATEAKEKKQQWQATLQELHFDSVQESNPSVQEFPLPKHEPNKALRRQVIEALAQLILTAKPLAELILTDDFTPEERELLRQLTQVVRSNGVFDLSNLLNRLCSERARRDIKP